MYLYEFFMSHVGVSLCLGLEPKKAEEELSEENGAEAILDSRNTLTLATRARLDAFGHTLHPLISISLKWVDHGTFLLQT